MDKLFEIEPVLVDQVPRKTEHGKLYISHKYKVAIHLCACGCGEESVTPFGDSRGWKLKEKGNKYTLSPSIGNFNGEKPYHAHYYIRDNKIVWCKN